MGQFPVTFQINKHYQVDKTYIWLGPLVAVVVVMAVAIVSNIESLVELYFFIMDGALPLALPLMVFLAVLAIAVLFGICVLIYWFAYKNMSFVFGEREFSFYSGVFVKKRVHLPYERVQSVNQNASLAQRIAGVCTVVIDSAGGASNKGVKVPYVRLQVAERMRSDLFMHKEAIKRGASVEFAGEVSALGAQSISSPSVPTNALDSALGPVGEWRGAFGGSTFIDEPVSFEYGLTNAQLALASFTHPGPLIGGLFTAIGVLIVAIVLFMVEEPIASILGLLSLPLIIGSGIGIWLIASIGILLGYGNFKVRRRGTRIEIERGLITRHFSGIDVSRIQSVNVKQSLIRNLMHYCELTLGRIDVQSGESSNNQSSSTGLLIHPFLKVDQVDAVLNGLLPEFDQRPRLSESKALPRVALRRALLRYCLWYNWALWLGLFLLAGLFLARWFVLADPTSTVQMGSPALVFFDVMIGLVVTFVVIASIVIAINSVLWARNSSYSFEGRFLLIHNGGLYTSSSLIPRQKIQSGYMRSNPFQRRLHLQTIVATTAAGYNKTNVRLMDLAQEDAQAYLEWLR